MRTEDAPQNTPRTIYLKDYRPPAWLADGVELAFRIFEDRTEVTSRIRYRRNGEGDFSLNAEHMEIESVRAEGDDLPFRHDGRTLTLDAPGDDFTLEIVSRVNPAGNTRLEGLYKSGGNWCTQCEAEGFRTITPFPDRPDVMTVFTVRIEADRESCPVLLSNGNLMDEGGLPDGRHYAVWHDPFPKPCYLFALVAGRLEYIQDHFTTQSGRRVDLRIYVRDGDQGQCHWAMESLKRSMKWDEDVYGREYELDRFNIVAVSDFNMGAMENTSLNIFNTALVLAHPDTATDTDFARVEGVIAHEYFHNWTGNRVTCRDWFQLSLKEGLTVFRDQEFSADMNSRDVQRIDDVAMLRRMQFAEDAGPLAHPIRPDNYIEINNFYTVTVYEKGAEVIRMQHTLLGPETYRKATDLYFGRYDGMAVTCEDFVRCMEDASGRDLSQFRLWYEQAGTPVVTASGTYDEAARRYTLALSQAVPPTPGQPAKKPMHIPVRVGLIGPNGDDMGERLLELREETQAFTFDDVPSRPVPSILRGFSAPVRLRTDLSDDDLRFLMVHDSDGFNRWEAGRQYMLGVLRDMIGRGGDVPGSFIETYDALLDHALRPDADGAFMARAISLPDIATIAQEQEVVDTDAIHGAREKMLNLIAEACAEKLGKIYELNRSGPAFENTGGGRARRLLQNTAMLILSNRLTARDAHRGLDHYRAAGNMTDRMAALHLGCALDGPAHDEIVGDFYERFRAYPLVIDKWFSAQAAIHLPKTMGVVRALRHHPDFNIRNPNRVRSLYAAFAMGNPVRFHSRDGEGYRFLADAVIELNGINPQIAARILTPMKEWRRYTPDRQALMRENLRRVADTPGLSSDVYEIVTKTLAA